MIDADAARILAHAELDAYLARPCSESAGGSMLDALVRALQHGRVRVVLMVERGATGIPCS